MMEEVQLMEGITTRSRELRGLCHQFDELFLKITEGEISEEKRELAEKCHELTGKSHLASIAALSEYPLIPGDPGNLQKLKDIREGVEASLKLMEEAIALVRSYLERN